MILKSIKKTFIRSQGQIYKSSSTPLPLQDWQYVAKIDENLKQGNINQAMKFLINSHLCGKILDMQTYRNMHYQMSQLKAHITYQELTYKFYRQYFKPHVLMIQWMKMLCLSEDPNILKILEADFKLLNLQMTPQEWQSQQQKQEKLTKNEENGESSQKKQKENQKIGRKIADKNKKNAFKEGQTKKQKEKPQQNINEDKKNKADHSQQYTVGPEEIKNIIESLLANNSLIRIHDVQIYCNSYIGEDDDRYDELQNQSDDEDAESFQGEDLSSELQENLFNAISSVNKIKIGRIEIIENNKNKGDDDQKL